MSVSTRPTKSTRRKNQSNKESRGSKNPIVAVKTAQNVAVNQFVKQCRRGPIVKKAGYCSLAIINYVMIISRAIFHVSVTHPGNK